MPEKALVTLRAGSSTASLYGVKSRKEDAQPQQLPKEVGPVRNQPQDTGMARRLRSGGEHQEALVAGGAGFGPDGLGGLKNTLPKLVANASFLEWSRDITQYAHMHNSVRGLLGEARVPVGGITPTSADHVAAGHTLDDIRVSMTAWKILWASLSTKADKNLMNWHKRPTDVWRQLESRHAPKTTGDTPMLLKKHEHNKIVAPTSDPILDIAALSDIRAQLSVREIAITDQTFCVPCSGPPTSRVRVRISTLSICADCDHPRPH